MHAIKNNNSNFRALPINKAYDNFVMLLKSIANVLKCKVCFKGNFKCVCITMFSLVMSLFSRDYVY